MSKLRAILEVSGHTPDLGARPYQYLSEVFKLHNRLAHGGEAIVKEEGLKVERLTARLLRCA